MADPNTPETKPEADELPTPKPGQKDTDHIVRGALGEPLPGAIADVTDGD